MVRIDVLKDYVKENQGKSARKCSSIEIKHQLRLEANMNLDCLVQFYTDCVWQAGIHQLALREAADYKRDQKVSE